MAVAGDEMLEEAWKFEVVVQLEAVEERKAVEMEEMLEFLEVLVKAGVKTSGPGRCFGTSMAIEYGELRGVGGVQHWCGLGM